MASGAHRNAPPAGAAEAEAEAEAAAETENVVNEQPIEISSESDNEDERSITEAESDSSSAVSIINSVSDSSDSYNEKKLEDDFAAIMALPSKRYKQYLELCHLAFKLNVFDKIEVAINEFDQHAAIPPHIWLRYLKTLKVVTQTSAERAIFDLKCSSALSSYHDDQLADFVVKNLMEQPLKEKYKMWAKILADYGLDRVDFSRKLRILITTLKEKEEDLTLIEKTIGEQCPSWNSKDDELKAIELLLEEFKLELMTSPENSSWLQKKFILKADTLPIRQHIVCTLAKVFYEQSLAKYPTEDKLWLDYIAHMQTPLDATSKEEIHTLIVDGFLPCKPLELIRRALLVRPTVNLNHKFLQLMEHYKFSHERIESELKKHFVRIERYMEMSVELHLDHLAYRVRHLDADDKEQVQQLRAAFRNVWDRLSEQYGDMADTGFEVLQLWAQVEYAQLNSPDHGDDLWREILDYPGASTKTSLWISYAQMESEYNGGTRVGGILKQALMAIPISECQPITDLYRRYERCFGTYKTISECQVYCQAYSPQYTRHVKSWKPGRHGKKPFPPPTRKPVEPKKEHDQSKKPPPTQKRNANKKASPEPNADEPRGSNFKYSPSLEANKIFIKNLYPRCTKEELTKAFENFGTIKEVRLVYKLNKRFKGIAYIEYEKPEDAKKAVISGDGLEIGGLNIEVAISNPPPKPVASTSSAAAAGALGGGVVSAALAPRAEKRRMPTSLIPTKLVIQETKRRKKLELDEGAGDAAVSSTMDANGKNSNSNGKETANDKEKDKDHAAASEEDVQAPVPKSNDDFRKLFNI